MPVNPRPNSSAPRRIARRSIVTLACAVAVGMGAAACGSSTPSASANELVVKAPSFTLQGCTYVLDGTVPAGEPQGVQPHFSSFSPDPSATAALQSMKEHGGQALVNGFIIPGGTALYAGPDTSQPSLGTIPSNYAILAAEPIIWKTDAGKTWIAFFLSCGSQNLYWASLDQIQRQNPTAAESITPLITKDSLTPIAIANETFGWKDPKLTFIIGRGEMFGPVT